MTGQGRGAAQDPVAPAVSPVSAPGKAGRRPGATQTRDEIVASARRLFAEKGYDATTIRAIAGDAGVNPSLVYHFFRSKEGVFTATMELPVNPAELLPALVAHGPREQLGERLVRALIAVWGGEGEGNPTLALLRSATTNEQATAMLRDFMGHQVLDRLVTLLGVPKLRLEAAIGQLIGVLVLRQILRIEPLASAGEDELVELLAPTVQRYLTDDH
jgi:AcrR family transcriptional regulator